MLKYEEFKGLYFKRWGIETKFDELKNKFQIENFSGIKPVIIEQDFYAILLLSNIASIFEQEAQEELKEKNEKNLFSILKSASESSMDFGQNTIVHLSFSFSHNSIFSTKKHPHSKVLKCKIRCG